MPRIRKVLPDNRADYSFGDLVYWHLFKYGTRPSGDPSNKAGRVWKAEAICALLDITDKTLRNWINDKHLPDSITDLCRELFGDNKRWDDARLELQDKLEQGRPKRKRKDRKTAASTSAGRLLALLLPPAKPGPSNSSGPQVPGEAQPQKSNAGQGGEASTAGSGQSGPSRFHAPDIVQPIPLREKFGGARPRQAAGLLVAALTLFAGAYALTQSRHAERSGTQPPKRMAEAPRPDPTAPKVVTERKESGPKAGATAATQQSPAAPKPDPTIRPTPIPPVIGEGDIRPVQPSRPPTEAERRAAEERRIEEEHFKARRAAHDLEMRRRDEEAVRRDTEVDGSAVVQRARDQDAGLAAGMGYRLSEHRSVDGSAFANMLVESVSACALACTRQSCDAFGFYREQYGPHARRPRYCYLFRKPFDVGGHPGYVLGERADDPPPSHLTAHTGSLGTNLILVQATSGSSASGPTDGLTRCATGPVKVSGFKLTCDQILGGGTTLGSTRLSYTVAHINECAARCRPVAGCTGFTFNGGDPEGRRACVIFGGKPEMRESAGWISGVR